MKKNLVIVRAGDSSLHPNWLLPYDKRNWDIVVNYFGDDEQIYIEKDVVRIDSKSIKLPAIYQLLKEYPTFLHDYEFIWLPDDDLDTSGMSINRLFDLMKFHSLSLAQPALSHQSYISHWVTLQNPTTQIRFGNFIEVMAPCFSKMFLVKAIETFNISKSGWGIDYLWSTMLDPMQSAVLDEITVTHTRPVGGPIYNVIKAFGVTAEEEKQHVFERYMIPAHFHHKIFGVVDLNGCLIKFSKQASIRNICLCARLGMFNELKDQISEYQTESAGLGTKFICGLARLIVKKLWKLRYKTYGLP